MTLESGAVGSKPGAVAVTTVCPGLTGSKATPPAPSVDGDAIELAAIETVREAAVPARVSSRPTDGALLATAAVTAAPARTA
jgi:hypothetical protein